MFTITMTNAIIGGVIGAIIAIIFCIKERVDFGEFLFGCLFSVIVCGIIGIFWFIAIPLAIMFTGVYFSYEWLKGYVEERENKKKHPNSNDDGGKQHRAVRATKPASEVFDKINQLKQSKFSKGMLLEQYEKELEQIIAVISGGEMYDDWDNGSYRNYTTKMKIPEASVKKFIQVVAEFKVLVDHAESEIKRLEQEERDRIDNQNNKALDDIHQLLVAIKKDKIGE